MELTFSEAALAIVRFCGNPKEFLKFHEVGSRLVTVRYENGCVITTLLVPSEKVTPLCVLIMIFCGVERKPTLSRTVTVLPGYPILERITTADWFAVRSFVFMSINDVSPFTTTGAAM
jgi:hypothetical protein